MVRKSMLVVFFAMTALGNFASAQGTTATISGTVKDSTGAVMPGASVVVLNQDTGISRTVQADQAGRYSAPSLSLGNYQITASLPGFQTEVRRGIVLSVGREAVVNFQLAVGAVTQTVEVTGEAPLVDTTSSAIEGLVDNQRVVDLPLNGRSFEQLATLEPAVTLSRASSKGFDTGFTERISVAGANPNLNRFLLDGTDIMDLSAKGPGSAGGVLLGVETLREFKVLTSGYSAQYGATAAGVISAVTKSGTNELHGSVFEFLRNSALDSRNFYDVGEVPPFRRNQFGFTLGGPIVTNKTFFFGSYEGLRNALTKTVIWNVFSDDARRGFLPDRTGKLQFVGLSNNPQVQAWLNAFPQANGRDFGNGLAEYVAPTRQPSNDNYFVIRLDHSLSANDSLFGRYTFEQGDNTFAGGHPVNPSAVDSRNQYLTIEESHIFSANWLNTFRIGFNRSRPLFVSQPTIDLPSVADLVPGRPLLLLGSVSAGRSGPASLGTESRAPQETYYNLFEYSDDLTYTRGSHTVKTGALLKRLRLNRNAPRILGGSLTFGSIQDFLLGNPAAEFRAPLPGQDDPIRGTRMWIFGAYVQDDIRVLPKLTLNVGLRYEISTGPREVNGKYADLQPGETAYRVVNPLFETPSFVNFGPRFGFAWDPWGDGKTSIRGGYGIYYSGNFPSDWEAATREGPFYNLAAVFNAPLPAWTAFTSGAEVPKAEPQTINVTNVETMMQWNFNIQREVTPGTIVTAGYIGSAGRHTKRNLQVNINNFIFVDGKRFFPPGAKLINPAVATHKHIVTDGNTSYNGLVLAIKRRFSGGLQFQSSYTFAKSINDSDMAFSRDLANTTPGAQDPLDRGAERALAAFDIRHNLATNLTYELPFGPGKALGNGLAGAAAKILGGWQVNGILTLATGAPFTIVSSFNRSRDGTTGSVFSILTERPNLRPGANSNPILGSPDRWYDPSSFELQPAGFYGNLGRNTLTGPGFANFDASLVKDTAIPSISETFKLQFRFEMFNLVNRANFSLPERVIFRSASGIPNTDAGRITSTVTSSRQMQFGLKVLF